MMLNYCTTVVAVVVMATTVTTAVIEDESRLIQRLNKLELQQKESESKIKQLRDITTQQSETLIKLRTKKESQKQLVARLTQQVMDAEVRLDTGVQQALKQCTRNTSSGSLVTPYTRNETTRVKRQSEVQLGFTAFNDRTLHPSTTEIIKFTKVITNIGGGYNVNTGMFTANQYGTYLFSITISQNGEGQYIWADLLVNGVKQLEAVAETYHRNQDVLGTNVLVKYLQKGDLVWVASRQATQLSDSPSYFTSSFTGVFLHS